jgi:hypothetical protein
MLRRMSAFTATKVGHSRAPHDRPFMTDGVEEVGFAPGMALA